MAKRKNGYNWKARQVVEVTLDDSFKKQLSVQIDDFNGSKYDAANPLVLPSKKRQSMVWKKHLQSVKVLSKKQRKLYEKVVAKKHKKEKRAALVEALQSVQVQPEVLAKLSSITEIQTKGRKRMFDDDVSSLNETDKMNVKKQNLGGPGKKHRLWKKNEIKMDDPNIVGFNSSETDSDSEVEVEVQCTQASLNISNDNSLYVKNNIKITSKNPETIVSEKQFKKLSDCSLKKDDATNSKESANPVIRNEKKVFIPVDRDPEIQSSRLKLPIIGEEQVIMEAINENDVVIIAGETGCGKTTQLPQFLYESGYTQNGKLIGVTEPRRVATISMSHRVALELNLPTDVVSYLIRFEGNTTPLTQIKFMTDGVLLKEIQKDFMLSKYSVIVLDEAHERSIFTDILIGLLSRITLWRRKKGIPLKLIIMSATLRLTDFTDNNKLFKVTPPVIKVGARQYPVSVHFNKKTAVDYMKEAFRKACKIHTKLPEGGILIFLTGQLEVNKLVQKLRKTFPVTKGNKMSEGKTKQVQNTDTGISKLETDAEANNDNNRDDEFNMKRLRRKLKTIRKNVLPEINLENYAIKPTDDETDMFETDDEGIESNFELELLAGKKNTQPMWVLPLYSLLSSKEQAKVFNGPPPGCRICVVATNVAETSLTIPHVKYVIDCGRTKTRMYDILTGVSTFTVTWTSKASADQRAGRAGRTAAGHCYRLYSSAVFNDQFEEWSVPEIQRKPVDDLLLQMKAMKIDKVLNFPFPSPPDLIQLKSAERRLILLGALKPNFSFKDESNTKLTPLGESMAAFPVAPRFSKMLCLSQQHSLLPYTVTIIAALAVQEFLLTSNDEFNKIWRSWAGGGNSLLLGDVMVTLRALGAAEHAGITKEGIEKFCQRCGLRYKAVVEARKLRVQLTNELNMNVPNLDLVVDPKLAPPNDTQSRQLRQIIMAGMVDQVAHKLTESELKEVGLSVQKAAYRIPELDVIIFLNSSSVLRKVKPEWIVYQEVYQYNDRLYARGVTAIEAEWLPLYAPTLCNISEPMKDPPPYYEESSGRVMCFVTSTFGRSGWPLPIIRIEHPVNEDKFKWFASFVLEGLVCPKLNEYSKHLLSPPNTMFLSWTKFLMSRTKVLLKTLMEKEVHSKGQLLKQWQTNEKYMLSAYLEWLPLSAHAEIREMWPPL